VRGEEAVSGRKLLVLDTSFSLEMMVDRGLLSSVTCRDLDGYFEHVWSVHPFAPLVCSPEWAPECGRPERHEVSPRHTFIEGKLGFSTALKNFPKLNFLMAQLDMLTHLVLLFRKERISAIRAGDPLYLGIFGWLLSKLTGAPLVVRIGANNQKIREATGRVMMPRLFKSASLERGVERFVFRRAHLVAGANSDNLQFAIESGADPKRCTLFRYGNLIDPAHFLEPALRPEPESLPAGAFLMCIARLETVKRVADVVMVLAEVRRRGFDVKALLVGDGSERESLATLARELGVEDQVVFCGNRNQQWLAAMIPKALAVLSPHTGRALTEAALGAAAIAAYDVDWQYELIETGVTGELVTFGDWQALAAATVRLLGDRCYARRVGDNLRNRVMEMMDPVKLNRHEAAEYEKLIARRGGSATSGLPAQHCAGSSAAR
jgi:glycosyltransferase involved in cell wall biosynthesis